MSLKSGAKGQVLALKKNYLQEKETFIQSFRGNLILEQEVRRELNSWETDNVDQQISRLTANTVKLEEEIKSLQEQLRVASLASSRPDPQDTVRNMNAIDQKVSEIITDVCSGK
jgi:hypothetical protein